MKNLVLALLLIAAITSARAEPAARSVDALQPVASSPDREALWRRTLAKPSLAIAAAFDDQGRLWTVSYREQHLYARYSDDLGATQSTPVRINPEPEAVLGDGENRPKLVVRGERLFVSYTRGLDKPTTGDIRFSRSLDGGKTFSVPITVNDNREVISHRFDDLVVDTRGQVSLAWLDKRDLEAARRAGKPYAGAAVYVARSTDGGKSFLPNRKLADHSCECCRVALAADRDGMPVAFWRHVFAGGIRDFALARFDAPLRRATDDGWRIDGCPHHGGALAIDDRGARHLVWFTGAAGKAGLYYRRIDGDGESASLRAPLAFGNLDAQPGHPTVLVHGDSVFLAWQEFDGRQTRIQLMASADRGQHWTAPVSRAATAGAADYPLLLEGRGKAWLAWNTADEGLRLFEL